MAAEVSADRTGLVSSTYLGGKFNDEANAAAVDGSGNIYITGYTDSPGFPLGGGAGQNAEAGFLDGFVTKLSTGAPARVRVEDMGISPGVLTVLQGGNVEWVFPNSNHDVHQVQDASGLRLFFSGDRPRQSYYAYTFQAAGIFPVDDPSTGASASVSVPAEAAPAEGTTTTRFRVRWSASPPGRDVVFDVAISRPGGSGFEPWIVGTRHSGSAFVADAGVGTYRFQARVRNPSTGATSLWSPPASITVTERT